MYSFYIESNDGKVSIQQDLTKLQAVRRYNKALKDHSLNAKEIGWFLQENTLSQKLKLAKSQ